MLLLVWSVFWKPRNSLNLVSSINVMIIKHPSTESVMTKHTFNPSTPETAADGSLSWRSGLHSQFQASQDLIMRLSQKPQGKPQIPSLSRSDVTARICPSAPVMSD